MARKATVKKAKAKEPEAPKTVTITIVEAMCDPVPLHVNGAGLKKLRVGETYSDITPEEINALEHSDVKFTVKE